MISETRAKWKRAEELVVEAGDMEVGDAAIMFVLAAVFCQRKFYNEVVGATLRGEEYPGMAEFQDLQTFRMIKATFGKDFESSVAAFMKSPPYMKVLNDSVVKELQDVVHRMVLAVMLKEKIGDKFYDV